MGRYPIVLVGDDQGQPVVYGCRNEFFRYRRLGDKLVWEVWVHRLQSVLNNQDQFGTSVALEGDLLAIGARRDDTGGVIDSGAVYLFKGASGEDFSGLTLSSKLASGQGAQKIWPISAAGSSFGTSVALNAGRLAVGAELESTGSREHGAVYLFSGAGSDFPV